jgi:uncharacterized protein YukE
MNTFDKNMEQFFDVIPTPIDEQKKKSTAIVPQDEPDLKTDLNDAYQQSRENLEDIISQGKEAMDEILQIAKAGQHPRAFEVYATLLKNMTEANDRLLKIQKEMREMDKKKETTNNNIDKAIFVGSTEDLNKLLNGNK